MSITSALFSATSGLSANGAALSVISNNIANVNTIGFKGSRAQFEDILSQSLMGASASSQIGRGVNLAGVQQIFTQGSFETTESGTDMAIDGDGFFMLRDGSALDYSRAGQFSFDNRSRLVNPNGYIVQGRLADATGTITGAITDIDFSTRVTSPANDTNNVEIVTNLDSTNLTPSTNFTVDSNEIISAADVASASNFSTSLTVFDSMGRSHTMTVFFRRAAQDTYQFHLMANAGDIRAGSTGFYRGGWGTLRFNSSGALQFVGSNRLGTFSFTGALPNQPVRFSFGTSISDGSSSGLNGTTQFAAPSATTSQSQDGFASGSLQSFGINSAGLITGNYSNGEELSLGQVTTARFQSPDGLTGMGNNVFRESGTSGQPIIGIPGSGGRGTISANSLELSNVDIASEFVRLMTTQRGFQVNSRTITVTDELLNELVNLIR